MFCVGAALLITARWLSPSPSGLGTHLQLGLPPCAFLTITSVPCPSCGLTTAFAYMVRGEVVRACSANALGAVLCALTWLSLPWALFGVVRARRFAATPSGGALSRLGLALAVLGLLQWLARAVHHVAQS